MKLPGKLCDQWVACCMKKELTQAVRCLVPRPSQLHLLSRISDLSNEQRKAFLCSVLRVKYVWWAICFKIVDSKTAVCAPTNRNYINSMVNKIDLICTTFNSIIGGGVHRLDLCLDHPQLRKSTWFTQWRKPTRSFTPLAIGISEREGTIPQLGVVKSHILQWPMMWRNRVDFLHRRWSSQMWHQSTQWSSQTWLEWSRFCWASSWFRWPSSQ